MPQVKSFPSTDQKDLGTEEGWNERVRSRVLLAVKADFVSCMIGVAALPGHIQAVSLCGWQALILTPEKWTDWAGMVQQGWLTCCEVDLGSCVIVVVALPGHVQGVAVCGWVVPVLHQVVGPHCGVQGQLIAIYLNCTQ